MLFGCHIVFGYNGLEPAEQDPPQLFKQDGEICIDHDECRSRQCIDGVCCDTPCSDTCASCAQAGSEGVCTPYAADSDPEDECEAHTLDCQQADCNGTMGATACAAPDNTECIAASCSNGLATSQGVCESGVCNGSVQTSCDPYICADAACHTSCSSGMECAEGFECTNNSCQMCPGGICTEAQANQISCGSLHCCAVLAGGAVQCWGRNEHGQLGSGTSGGSYATPVTVMGITGATAVSAGGDRGPGEQGGGHSCALIGNSVQCWGRNHRGQLGNGMDVSNGDSPVPVSVVNIDNATAISLGGNNSCALLSDLTVRCWGNNFNGQLGNGTSGAGTESSTPQLVSGVSTGATLSTGSNHSCVVLNNNTAQCWGLNDVGQLGNGMSGIGIFSAFPVGVSPLAPMVTAVAAGGTYLLETDESIAHSCALLDNMGVRSVWCWGSNVYGQLGDGGNMGAVIPVEVAGLTEVAEITVGFFHSCARMNNGTVQCWGANMYGQLGQNDYVDQAAPIEVPGLDNVVALASGGLHTCALRAGGAVYCWGRNGDGQLGIGVVNDSLPVPLLPVELSSTR